MIAYLQFEWLKLSKRMMPRILMALIIGLTAVTFWGQGTRSHFRGNLFLPRGWLVGLTLFSFFAAFFWPVLGGTWAGNEYGWGTIRTILTRRPYRIQHVLATLAILTAGVGVGILAVLAVATVGSLAISELTGNPAWISSIWSGTFFLVLIKGFLAAWFVSTFYLLFAYAAATIARSAAVGIGVGIGGTFAQLILTRIFSSLGGIWNDISLQFPFTYASNMITRVVGGQLIAGSGLASVDPGTPSATASVIALLIYAAIFLGATLVVVRTRDVTS